MTNTPAYAAAVADYGRRFIAAKTDRERENARADFDAQCILLRTLGEREAARACDADAERMLTARFGERLH